MEESIIRELYKAYADGYVKGNALYKQPLERLKSMDNKEIDYYADKYLALQKENEHLRRKILGLETTIKNLQERLGKRDDRYFGEVQDIDHRKRPNR